MKEWGSGSASMSREDVVKLNFANCYDLYIFFKTRRRGLVSWRVALDGAGSGGGGEEVFSWSL